MVWIICVVLINPVGDFPLNDDWAYGLPAEVLVKEHVFKLTDWQAAALVTQLGWGALCNFSRNAGKELEPRFATTYIL